MNPRVGYALKPVGGPAVPPFSMRISAMYVQCILYALYACYVYAMYMCNVYMQCICNVCAMHMCTVCAMHVQCMCNVCAMYVQCMCNVCAMHVQCMCNVCAMYTCAQVLKFHPSHSREGPITASGLYKNGNMGPLPPWRALPFHSSPENSCSSFITLRYRRSWMPSR